MIPIPYMAECFTAYRYRYDQKVDFFLIWLGLEGDANSLKHKFGFTSDLPPFGQFPKFHSSFFMVSLMKIHQILYPLSY